MIDKLKKKTFWVIWGILMLVFVGVLLTINITNYQANIRETRRQLMKMSELEDEGLPKEPPKELLEKGDEMADFHMRVTRLNQRTMYIISAVLLVIGMMISFVVAWFLSKWLVKPVQEAFEKQKAFISDAGHELKTPITVINANIDTMEMENGDNKHIHYIKDEIMKMSTLVQNLLTLARVENTEIKTEFAEFNLSKAVLNATLPFESVAFEHGLSLQEEVQEELLMCGNEGQMKQVVAILIDNAIKHAKEGSAITVSLQKEKNKHLLKVHNFGESIDETEREKIFEKFYRGDKSRNRDAGRYGLGLAIAKNIVDLHHGKIWVHSQEGETCFYVNV